MTVCIRAETPADVAAIGRVLAGAFAGLAEARLVEAIRAAPGFDPRLSLVAEVDGEIEGHLLFSPVVVATASRDVPALALAPLAVSRGHEHLHLGTLLMRHGLAECARLGHSVVLVLGHRRYYPRFGFRRAARWGIASPWPQAGDAFMALALRAGALDHVAGMARYPAPFDGV